MSLPGAEASTVIRAINIQILQKSFPEFTKGIEDFRSGRWTEIASNDRSYIYELGRLYAQEVPATDAMLGAGFITLSPYLEQAIKDICG